ncbi:hypothetical protein BH09GEM1_BH09GEM1_36180 [soil metagenome]
MRPLLMVWVLAVVGVAACHHAPAADTPATADAQRTPHVYDTITRDELAEQSQLGTTAYLAIQRLRPAYLIDKTAGAAATIHPISVSVNGGQLSSVNALISIPTQTIAEIRYLDLGNAAARFHNRATGPVILVTLTTLPSP